MLFRLRNKASLTDLTGIILLAVLQMLAEAQSPPSVCAGSCDKAPKIDGQLDEPAWANAQEISGFITIFPVYGQQPSEKTVLKILRDKDNIYFGIYCFDREPQKISANTMSRDAQDFARFPGDDVIKILLDPYQDRRNAFVFVVNPRGARAEGLASGEQLNLSWDGIWEAKSRIQKDGWTVEIKIPLKTIGFKPNLHYWGFNFERYIPRKQETIRLAARSQNSHFTNASEAAVLEGIEGASQGLGLTFRPYGLGSSEATYAIPEISNRYTWQGGFDLYKRFTPSFTGAFTYNTDFAETEADERRINLTRFPLQFPEKRTFFLEGSEIFNFGPGGFRTFTPFFSRRIGLYEEHQVPVAWGLKLFGKLGQTNLAILDMQTKDYVNEPDNINLKAQNFLAARVYQNIFEESRVGLLFTRGEPTGLPNTLAGVDFVYQTSRFRGRENFLAGFWYLYNWNDLPGTHREAYGVRLDYPNDLWDINTAYNYFGDAFEPGLGFITRQGVRNYNLGISYQPRPEKGWIGEQVRQFIFEFRTHFFWRLNRELETRRIFLTPINIRMESGERIQFGIIDNFDSLVEDFEVSENVIIPAAPYRFTQYQLQLETASYRPWSFRTEYNFGEFYSGRYRDLKGTINFRIKGNFNFSFNFELARGVLPQGTFDERVFELKADFFLNPDLGIMNYFQYDTISGNLGINSRLRWIIRPGNEVYLIYTRSWQKIWDPISRFEPTDSKGVFKVTLSIRP